MNAAPRHLDYSSGRLMVDFWTLGIRNCVTQATKCVIICNGSNRKLIQDILYDKFCESFAYALHFLELLQLRYLLELILITYLSKWLLSCIFVEARNQFISWELGDWNLYTFYKEYLFNSFWCLKVILSHKYKNKGKGVLWKTMFLIFISKLIGQGSILCKFSEYLNHALF